MPDITGKTLNGMSIAGTLKIHLSVDEDGFSVFCLFLKISPVILWIKKSMNNYSTILIIIIDILMSCKHVVKIIFE